MRVRRGQQRLLGRLATLASHLEEFLNVTLIEYCSCIAYFCRVLWAVGRIARNGQITPESLQILKVLQRTTRTTTRHQRPTLHLLREAWRRLPIRRRIHGCHSALSLHLLTAVSTALTCDPRPIVVLEKGPF